MSEQAQEVTINQEHAIDDSPKEKYLTFFIDGQLYAIPSSQVIEIIRMQAITFMPKLPGFIKGVINLRGKIVPLVDVRNKFGKEEAEYNERTSIIVADINEMGVGLIVDTVNDVSDISESQISPAPKLSQGQSSGFISGIAHLENTVAMLLDSEMLISDTVARKETAKSKDSEEPAPQKTEDKP